MGAQPVTPFPILGRVTGNDDVKEIIQRDASNEFVFAVVGHAGSGTTMIATALEARLLEESMEGHPFQVAVIKARQVIQVWAEKHQRPLPEEKSPRSLKDVELFQDYGDEMRSQLWRNMTADYSSVARGLVRLIQEKRSEQSSASSGADSITPGGPDRRPRAFILDSIRHPAEVELLRYIYGDAFVLIGVVCEENKRVKRIQKKYDSGESSARTFMERDANADKKHGQHVADAFHLADFFVDNTADRPSRPSPSREDSRAWKASEDLSRLVKLITGKDIIRPVLAETAMYHAFSSQLQSACLSRQVGAALVDPAGNVVATGTNEVPRAGGGVYGESIESQEDDGRCAYRLDGKTGKHICRNTNRQNEIIDELLEKVPELKRTTPERKKVLVEEVRRTRIGGLLEFSRAVHAEMDALLSAGRKGISTVGCRLFVTTYPCHYCARHIVSAGVDEVQFIEPYPKSLAIDMHDDSIVVETSGWKPPSQGGTHVRFRPFSGVSPRLYKRAFMKNRDLKDGKTGEMTISKPDWGSAWNLPVSGYIERESNITKEDSDA